jgi:hypothetical protein
MANDSNHKRHDGDGSDDSNRIRSRIEALLPPILRRTVETAQATEDVIRGMAGEIKLPKEAVGYIIEVADTTKKEVVRVAAREFREFLESANLTDEVAKLLTTLSFEIRTEIRFIPNDQALKPNVKSQLRVKSGDSELDETVRKDGGLVEGIDEFVRAGATELVDRLLRRKRDDSADTSAVAARKATEAPAAAAAPPAAKPRRRSSRTDTSGPSR